MTDRRFWFFVGAAIVCIALAPLAPREFRWVAEVTSGAYVVLAILVALDSISRRRPSHRKDRP